MKATSSTYEASGSKTGKARKIARGATAVAVAISLGVTGGIIVNSLTRKHNVGASVNEHDKALRKELLSAYIGPITIKAAENSGKVVQKGNAERAVIHVLLGGGAVNHETADNKSTPTYFDSDTPVGHLLLDDGESLPALMKWVDEDRGEMDALPNLNAFAGNTPVTRDYTIDLGVYGSTDNDQLIAGIYHAGELVLTGSKRRVTSVEVLPYQGPAPVELVTGKAAEDAGLMIASSN